MISTNVMSFMKKIVKPSRDETGEASGPMNKLKQTVTTGLQEMSIAREQTTSSKTRKTATSRLTPQERSILRMIWQKNDDIEEEPRRASLARPAEPVKQTAPTRESCRICLKNISDGEQNRECDECGQNVCEDCASYSGDPTDSLQEWKCSFCRRRQGQDRLGIELPPGSGMNRVPSVRRMEQRAREAGKEGYFSSLDPGSDFDILKTSEEATDFKAFNSIDESVPSFNIVATNIKGLTKDQDREIRNKRRSKTLATKANHRRQVSLKRKDSRPTVEKKKSTDVSKRIKEKRRRSILTSTGEYLSRSSSPEKHARERHFSFENLSDRCSSSESTKGMITSKMLALKAVYRKDDSHLGSYLSHADFVQLNKHSSASGSSLEESSHKEEKERKRRSRTKRRSKIQRQNYYVREPDSDPISYRDENFPKANTKTSFESSSAIDSLEKDLNYESQRRHSMRVPTVLEKPLRQIASETALDKRRVSSESSDTSDISEDISTHSDRSGFDGSHEGYQKGEKVAVQNPMIQRDDSKNIPAHLQFVEGGYFSPTGTADSSLSLDEHSHLSSDKSFSLDDRDIFRTSTPHIRRSIPSVLVDSVVDHQRSASVSLLTSGHYIMDNPFPRRNSTGRMLPMLPVTDNQLGLYPASQSRSWSTHSLDLPREESGWAERRASAPEGENIKIVVDDVDSHPNGVRGKSSRQPLLRLVRLHRDRKVPVRGFGLKVKGGKFSDDGHLHAYIAWTVAGGSAEKKGLAQGDRVLEWNGVSLVDKTYEEVSTIIGRSPDTVDLLVEKVAWRRLSDQLGSVSSPQLKHASLKTDHDTKTDVYSTSPTRRKLPKTPNDNEQRGRVQVQIRYDPDDSSLVITLLSARGLQYCKNYSGKLPRAYAKVRLVPQLGFPSMKTRVAEPGSSPKWNQTFIFPSVSSEELATKTLNITVWDQISSGEKRILGESQIILRCEELQECPAWYYLTSLQMAPMKRSRTCSMSSDDLAQRQLQHNGTNQIICFRSYSDGKSYLDRKEESLVKNTSMDSSLLHPDDACCEERAVASDGATNMEIIPLKQNRDSKQAIDTKNKFCFHSQDNLSDLNSTRTKTTAKVKSSSFRIHRPSNLDKEQGETVEPMTLGKLVKNKLCRTLSMKSDKNQRSVGLELEKRSTRSRSDLTSENEIPIMTIGPNGIRRGSGQVFSRKIKFSGAETLGDIKLGFLITKGHLEVQVICARQLRLNTTGQPPDTYVKTYLKEGERQMQKRKTKVVRHSSEPQYRQTVKYSASNIQGRHLLVMVWERQKGFEHNKPLGAADIQLDRLDFSKLIVCWYPLYPILHEEMGSNESV
ncbi:regulating synaptic membrane exocytosis protein 2-like [Limulus polyphemus]|uniref:Regulating synaptic membrane exocytosis protein 2-like n=1 Tax=Limulus polyphemus TaxID=6850 RepID=A0ABM1TSJ9_LIMPO|nr:regulating synaptic membrane exocytosis protein 2-like [Limulus polyphemus]